MRWEETTLGEVCTLSSGGTPSKAVKKYWNGKIPWVSGKDMKVDRIGDAALHISESAVRESATKIAPIGSLLILVRGMGLANGVPIAQVTSPCAFNQDIRAIHPPKNVDARYLMYALRRPSSPLHQIRTNAAHGTLKIDTDALLSVRFPMPPLVEQRRIVGILDEAFAGIARAVAATEKNLANARELFESYLRSTFASSSDGWNETTIGDQLILQRGFDITKSEQTAGDVPVVSSGGVKSYHNVAMSQGPGVVVGRKGTIGRVHFVDRDYWPHDTTLWVKDFKGNNPRLVYYLFCSLDLAHLDTGTANPALNRNLVHPIAIKWPKSNFHDSLVDKLDALSAETQRLETLYRRKLAALSELKQSILQKAFAGELTGKELEEGAA